MYDDSKDIKKWLKQNTSVTNFEAYFLLLLALLKMNYKIKICDR